MSDDTSMYEYDVSLMDEHAMGSQGLSYEWVKTQEVILSDQVI